MGKFDEFKSVGAGRVCRCDSCAWGVMRERAHAVLQRSYLCLIIYLLSRKIVHFCADMA